MGEKQHRPFQLSFNASLKVGIQGSRVTSDGGLLPVRELMDAKKKKCRGNQLYICLQPM